MPPLSQHLTDTRATALGMTTDLSPTRCGFIAQKDRTLKVDSRMFARQRNAGLTIDLPYLEITSPHPRCHYEYSPFSPASIAATITRHPSFALDGHHAFPRSQYHGAVDYLFQSDGATRSADQSKTYARRSDSSLLHPDPSF